VISEGYRYHLTNVMASVGISQLKRVNDFIASRQAVCDRYSAAFDSFPGVRLMRGKHADVSPFIYSLRVLDGHRTEFIDHMRAQAIDVGVHFIPVHRHAWFSNARSGPLPVTERVAAEVVTLPLHSEMQPAFVERVIDAVSRFFGG
jgi:dTDP-4-amino-4,6-dideoxygalactose transaminase